MKYVCFIKICISYHEGEAISILSVERRHHILSRVSATNEGNLWYCIFLKAIKMISYRSDNLLMPYVNTCAFMSLSVSEFLSILITERVKPVNSVNTGTITPDKSPMFG